MFTKQLKLNADLGENYGIYKLGLDQELMPYLDMANLACGFHASDPLTMYQSVQLAKAHSVEIGCHPSYPDLVGFGRREMKCTADEIKAFVVYLLGALEAFCQSMGTQITYVKPHGALYNVMMRDEEVFLAIVEALALYNSHLKLMILSTMNNERYATLAQEKGIELIYEIFADRAYTDEGFLLSRNEKNAVINNKEEVLERLELLMKEGIIETITGKKLRLQADSICVHGDNQSALVLVKAIYGVIHGD